MENFNEVPDVINGHKWREYKEHHVPAECKAGDKRVLVNGKPLPVDFRVIAEDEYQYLIMLIDDEKRKYNTLRHHLHLTEPATLEHAISRIANLKKEAEDARYEADIAKEENVKLQNRLSQFIENTTDWN